MFEVGKEYHRRTDLHNRPDDSANVIVLCPNFHSEVHHGMRMLGSNTDFIKKNSRLES